MFRQRLLAALVLIPLVLALIYWADTWLFGSVLTLLMLGGGWEWAQLIPIQQRLYKAFFSLVLLATVWLVLGLLNDWLATGLVLWLFIAAAVLTFPRTQGIWGDPIVVGGGALLLLPLVVATLLAIHELPEGKSLLVYLLCLVWAADIGAYFAGKGWGRHKLIPKVSPGKTVEGLLGGLALGMVVAGMGAYYFKPNEPAVWYFIAVVTLLISMLGDLFISMLKRRCHLKDTGHLIPGHGGLLDRLDSLIAAAPWFYAGLYFFSPGW